MLTFLWRQINSGGRERKREEDWGKLGEYCIYWFTSQMVKTIGTGSCKLKNQELHPGLCTWVMRTQTLGLPSVSSRQVSWIGNITASTDWTKFWSRIQWQLNLYHNSGPRIWLFLNKIVYFIWNISNLTIVLQHFTNYIKCREHA